MSQSKGSFRARAPRDDAYRRRRMCAECLRTFPTREVVDVEQLRRELARQGLSADDVTAV